MDLAAELHKGVALHNAGRLTEARDVYRRILALAPGNFDCLHLLGVAECQHGNYIGAIELFKRAIAANPKVAEVHSNYGVALNALQRYEDAIESFNRAIAINPDYSDAFNNRGSALAELGRAEEAITSFDRAIAINPAHADAIKNRGRARGVLHRYREAISDFDRLIELDPRSADGHSNRGIALGALEQHDAALASLDRALALQPDHAEAQRSRGLILNVMGRQAEAVASFERVIALYPKDTQTLLDHGIALHALGRLSQALLSFDRALAVSPTYVAAHNNKAAIFIDLNRHADALASCNRAIAIEPDCAIAHYTRAIALEGLGRLEEAIESYTKALSYDPDMELVPGKRLHTIMQTCRWDGLEDEYRAILRRIDDGHAASPPFTLLAIPSSPLRQRKAAELFCRNRLSTDASNHWPTPKRRSERLRIGYFSADFYNHATALLAAGLFELHDRSAFEVIGFSYGVAATDPMRDRLSTAFDRFVDVSDKGDTEIAAMARDMGIDIAVDLKGHTLASRPGIFVHRAAPLQGAYLGYPGTTAMPSIDYLIADPVLIPPEHRPYYSEKIAYIPPSYQVNDSKRTTSARRFTKRELDLPETGFVFCCFNNSYKITPAVFDVWMRLLHAVEGSVLWLLESSAVAMANLRAEAQKRGIAPQRLIFAPRMDPADHLARHSAADLFLDTFYCNAHTTASDALWAGVPVLTKLGDTFTGRVAASLLTAIGLPDLIVGSDDAYEKRALALAANPAELGSLKRRLMENKATHPLFDTMRFTRNIEDVYLRMWARYESGARPDHLEVKREG